MQLILPAAAGAIADEHAHIQSILAAEETEGRHELALRLVYETALSIADARPILAVAPMTAPATSWLLQRERI